MDNHLTTPPVHRSPVSAWRKALPGGMRLLVSGLLSCLLAAACRPLVSATLPVGSSTPEVQPTPSQVDPDVSPAESNTSITTLPTEVLVGGSPYQPDPIEETTRPTAASPPLRFVFPTPGPAPVSAWRPPLYSVPWAPTPFDHFYFSRPIAADQINWPLPDYRYGGIFFSEYVHTGVDIPAPNGTPVLAAGPGRIVWAGYGLFLGVFNEDDPYGLAVAIRHDFGHNGEPLYTLYGHMSEIQVVRGQRVVQGEKIGEVGETGQTTGPHLHFEVRLGENLFTETRNPELWIAPPQGWGVLVGRITDETGYPMYEQAVNVRNLETGQKWVVRSYGPKSVNEDEYYQENVVLGDLPAGDYILWLNAGGLSGNQRIQIRPGLVTYFTFGGDGEFGLETPPAPELFIAPDAVATP